MANPLSRATRELGERIRERRLAIAATQEEVAGVAEVDTTTFGKVERGERNINLHNLIRIADALQVDPGSLLAGLSRDMVPAVEVRPSPRDRLERKRRESSAEDLDAE
jgi:transcriptional regulator with XRE-family HTH domain